VANTSATGGYLLPEASPDVLEDDALLDFLQEWISGVSGLAGPLIRPRWQPESSNIPPENITWAAFGIIKRDADAFAYEVHKPAGDGYNEMRRQEILSLLISFYGPKAYSFASQFRDGLQISQNREILLLNNIAVISSGDLVTMPELVKEKWYQRTDLAFDLHRQILRRYPILHLLETVATIDNEIEVVTIIN
jgi:hypothetical protein